VATGGTPGIGTRTLQGVLWGYGSYALGRVLVLGATALLARLLTPEQFGVVALALIAITLLESLKDLGVGQALVVTTRDEDIAARASTAFVLSVGLGVLLAVAVAAISPLAASYFHEPDLRAIVPVLGANFLLRSLGATHYALAQRDIDFRRRTVAELSDVVVRGAVGIGLALAGAGVWSLVLAYLCGTLAMDLALWALVDFRPRLRRFDRDHARELVSFGAVLTAVDVVAAVSRNVDYILVGRVLGAAQLGLYSLAFRLPELVVVNLSVVIGQVLYPAFATVDRRLLPDAFVTALRYTVLVSLPLGVALCVLAEPVVGLTFGDQWDGTVEPMRLLAVWAVAVTVGIPAGTAYKATGRARVILALSVPATAALVVALALLADHGIVTVARCVLAVTVVYDVGGLLLAARMLGVGTRRIGGAILPSALAACAMAAIMVPLARWIDADLACVLAAGAAGAAAYVASLVVLAPDTLRRLRTIARPA
jgi:PST family polysaccharide transporter